MNQVVVALTLVGGLVGVSAQEPDRSSLAFEVASVKPAGPPVAIGRLPPGHWRSGRATLLQLIGRAYPQYPFGALVVGGPAWVREARFEIDARMDPKAIPVETAMMIARLLADRFSLRTHIEQRPVDIYVLKMSRDDAPLGPQLKRADPSCAEARAARQPLSPECSATATSGLHYRAMQISDFIRLLSGLGIDRPVLDRTGLTGYFDLQLQYDYSPFSGAFRSPPSAVGGLSFFTALQEQAGLKLEAAREVVDVLVIDSVEMPTPN